MRTRTSRLRRLGLSEAGVTTLEVAFGLPVLLLLIFAVAELGYNVFARTTVEKAAQVGARFAVTGQGYDQGNRLTLIQDAARKMADVLTGGNPANKSVTVTVSSYDKGNTSSSPVLNSAGVPCDAVEVRVDYTYTPLTPFAGPLLPATMTVTGKERMINEPWVACQ